ncbi:nucleoside hydrolase [Humibacter albus]|uniref:nucleoside hydrolase n=1 Tax=Humibacter albus TaxID=427754 RepID=UPI001B7F9F86|nr:nucleoside hydrolase [Humibacter albus]
MPIIIDCDPGHDDVLAIWLAAGNPDIDLRAITTVAGNGSLEHTTLNARVATTVAAIAGVPIAAGAAGPLTRKLRTAPHIHGDNALGGVELPEPTTPLDPRTAIELIVDTLNSSTETVTLVPTGPLTNIGQLIQEHPEVLPKVERIVWMGGSTTRGNMTAYAEFNAWVDPEAIDIVVKSGIPFTMVGLNITHQALITQDVIERIAAIGNQTSAFGVQLLRFFNSTYEAAEGMSDGPLHDPITVALLADPNVVESIESHIDVEVNGTYTAGATCIDIHDMLGQPNNVTVPIRLNVDRYWDLIVDAIAHLR